MNADLVSIKASSQKIGRVEALRAAFAALLLGASLIYVTGFSSLAPAHDAAHDQRHALSFPCH